MCLCVCFSSVGWVLYEMGLNEMEICVVDRFGGYLMGWVGWPSHGFIGSPVLSSLYITVVKC